MSAFLVKVSQAKNKMTFRSEQNETVAGLKQKIYATTYLPIPAQRLMFKGRELADGAILSQLGLRSSSRIMLMFTKAYYVPHSPLQKLHECGTAFLELKARTSADVKAAGVLCIEDLDGKTKKKIDEQVTRLLMKLDAVEVDTELRVIRKKLSVDILQWGERVGASNAPPKSSI